MKTALISSVQFRQIWPSLNPGEQAVLVELSSRPELARSEVLELSDKVLCQATKLKPGQLYRAIGSLIGQGLVRVVFQEESADRARYRLLFTPAALGEAA